MTKKQQIEEIQKYIPSGAQTLSKSPGQYVIGVSPVMIERGKGAYLWDVEGKKYLDTLLALGAMIFGYANERIDRAVKLEMDKGTIFSLPSVWELKLAKLLKEVVPCAEMSRFLLNGNDATSGAVRLARYVTKRDHIAKCGYHGYQDWSICTKDGRNAGVPELIKTLTHEFVYNDISSLEKIFNEYPGKIAAVILEPVSTEKPKDDFLGQVKAVAEKNGALLIFDEMVTGFRWALGGAQEYFKVTPDIACFSKAISNGYPLSVIAGKAKYMEKMDEIFVSTTYGGSIPGVVAAIESIAMMREFGDVHQHMHELGDHLIFQGNMIADKYGIPVKFIGYGPHPVMQTTTSDEYLGRLLKSFIYQEMNEAGVLFSSSMLIGYVHQKQEIDQVLKLLETISTKVQDVGDIKKLESLLKGEVVKPRTVRAVQ